ncbi:hypothetical protein P7K49_026708 [Saguinus oedipus]|uniref:Uncharacterized protein n=1 Tax=Saguinus oedipus TaxID=9490 RepID=A0ABQ9UDX8_SAGOE|nr:hypothetical protein P7K49_026708 [Saguinus oedipus]
MSALDRKLETRFEQVKRLELAAALGLVFCPVKNLPTGLHGPSRGKAPLEGPKPHLERRKPKTYNILSGKLCLTSTPKTRLHVHPLGWKQDCHPPQ